MTTTQFRPSIHGWPFSNSYDHKFDLPFHDITIKNMGYCGGMCWAALKRYYSATRMPRDAAAPQQGDALYGEIYDEQKSSLSFSKLVKIFSWQQSPQLSHRFNAHHSQGYLTREDWPDVKARLDDGRPVTLTLIAHSNDYDITDMSDNHRVVAYAYDSRALASSDSIHGARHSGIRKITLSIYDPNCHDQDDVRLSFFTGCDDEWIGLHHSQEGGEFRAFFLDDKNRDYQFSEPTSVSLDSCDVTSISSFSQADVALKFSWHCRVIPWFSVQVNGVDWQLNDVARATFVPDGDDKQCSARNGTLSLALKIPRAVATVGVRLFEGDRFAETIEVDASPAVSCAPYVRTRFASDASQVYDSALQDADLYVRDAAPTEAALLAIDDSPDRWVHGESGIRRDPTGGGDRWVYTPINTWRLGNVISPILASFPMRNLAVPVTLTGTRRVTRAGVPGAQVTTLANLNASAQEIWHGFVDPADYDDDVKVELTFTAKDRFNRTATVRATFYGRSILHSHIVLAVSVPDPRRIAKLQDAARQLVEMGLLETTLALPTGGGAPPPGPIDEGMWKRLRGNPALRDSIRAGLEPVWKDASAWASAAKAQEEIVAQASGTQAGRSDASRTLVLARKLDAEGKQELDAAVIQVFATKGVETLSRDTALLSRFRALSVPVGPPVVAPPVIGIPIPGVPIR